MYVCWYECVCMHVCAGVCISLWECVHAFNEMCVIGGCVCVCLLSELYKGGLLR